MSQSQRLLNQVLRNTFPTEFPAPFGSIRNFNATTTKYLFYVSQCNTYNVQYISQDGCTLPSGHLVVGPY